MKTIGAILVTSGLTPLKTRVELFRNHRNSRKYAIRLTYAIPSDGHNPDSLAFECNSRKDAWHRFDGFTRP